MSCIAYLEPIRMTLHVLVQPLAHLELQVAQVTDVPPRFRTGCLKADEFGHKLGILLRVGHGDGHLDVIVAPSDHHTGTSCGGCAGGQLRFYDLCPDFVWFHVNFNVQVG